MLASAGRICILWMGANAAQTFSTGHQIVGTVEVTGDRVQPPSIALVSPPG